MLNGIVAIAQPLADRLHGRLGTLLLPLDFDETNRSAAIVLGFFLIYFGTKLLQRKIVAWWVALLASVIIALISLLPHHSLLAALLPAVTAAILVATRDQFRVKSEAENIIQGVRLLLLSIAVALAYGVAGFWLLERRDFGQVFGIRQAVIQTLRQYSLVGNPDLLPRTRQAFWFLQSLGLLGAVSLGFGVYSLFRPLAYRFATLPSEREEVEEILRRYGDSPEDFFKLWPEDKSYFFSKQRDAFLAYRVAASVAIVLNDPVGRTNELVPLIDDFIGFASDNGWVVAFVDVPKTSLDLYQKHNLRDLKIGEDAIINLEHFVAEVAGNKHFRNVRNRFSKEAYELTRSQPPHRRDLLSGIQSVSREWLKLPGREERGFALGYFNRRYLQSMPLYLLSNAAGRVVAFANQIPSYHSPIATIDLMRHRASSPPNTMDYLFLQIMTDLHTEGVKQFSLGLAPLSGTGEGLDRATEERLLGYLYRRGDRLFSFKGLRQFKNKFEPEWHEKFLVYSGGPQTIPQIALALSQVLKAR